MRTATLSRSLTFGALLFGLLAVMSGRALALTLVQQHAAPIERRAPGGSPQAARRGPMAVTHGEHLPQWMTQHAGMSLEQQQQALQREPGFRELPAPTQQRMLSRLSLLHSMTPLERQRMMDRTEAMERLTPDQRSEVRGAMQQLGALPPDQRREVARNFRAIRMLPPPERLAAINSPGARMLNYQQRTVLLNLIRVAPMLPAPEPPQPR